MYSAGPLPSSNVEMARIGFPYQMKFGSQLEPFQPAKFEGYPVAGEVKFPPAKSLELPCAVNVHCAYTGPSRPWPPSRRQVVPFQTESSPVPVDGELGAACSCAPIPASKA